MDCPNCMGKTTVVDTRPQCDCVKRVRKCVSCHLRFQTVEYEAEVLKKEDDRTAMEANEYQKAAMRTASVNSDLPTIARLKRAGFSDEMILLWNGVLGLGGESGECEDQVKKHIFQGHPLDTEHMAKELGDVAWYLAVAAHALGYDLETVLKMNVEKLKKRYPDGFSSDRSMHRESGDI